MSRRLSSGKSPSARSRGRGIYLIKNGFRYINGGFYRARTTRPETDDEIRARADDIVGDMVEDIGRSGFRPSVGKLLALREKIEQHSYARSIDYNGWW